jgi:hypothetical protein
VDKSATLNEDRVMSTPLATALREIELEAVRVDPPRPNRFLVKRIGPLTLGLATANLQTD